jgi:ATP-dependent Lon protease
VTDDTTPSQQFDKIPLFPLPNVVLFPGMVLPLHIFEPRYKTMFRETLEKQGSFGIQYCPNSADDCSVPFSVGTTVQVLEWEQLKEGRFNLLVLGKARFQVKAYDYSKPYLQGAVHWLQESREDSWQLFEDESQALIDDVRHLFTESVRLMHKILKTDTVYPVLPESPELLAYFIAQQLKINLPQQQEILETPTAKERLSIIHQHLKDTTSIMAIQAQIQDTFPHK